MSYAVDGRQCAAIAAGDHGGLDATSGNEVMVCALPAKGRLLRGDHPWDGTGNQAADMHLVIHAHRICCTGRSCG
ncbi:hypothetical protein [Rhodanobacter lindaniclasticus]|nr:hypothetical protein [Rhodanobacter lindaniclasticus]